jgi:hypothetical protein
MTLQMTLRLHARTVSNQRSDEGHITCVHLYNTGDMTSTFRLMLESASTYLEITCSYKYLARIPQRSLAAFDADVSSFSCI